MCMKQKFWLVCLGCLVIAVSTILNLLSYPKLQEIISGHSIEEEVSHHMTAQNDESGGWKHTPIYAPSNETVVALISPPGVVSGYRNQMLRFLAFITMTLDKGSKYILSQSLVSFTVDTVSGKATALAFSALFDFDYWNTFEGKLPQIVDYHESSNYTCWKMGDDENTTQFINERPYLTGATREIIRNGNFPDLFDTAREMYGSESRYTLTNIRLKSNEYTNRANSCQGNPIPLGGGGKALALWGSAQFYMQKYHPNSYPHGALANFHKALRPNKKWRDLVQKCVGGTEHNGMYLGIHVRAEPEMMVHKCSKMMEQNVTKIFAYVDEFLLKYYAERNDDNYMKSISIATNLKDYEKENVPKRFKHLINENIQKLNYLTRNNITTHTFGGKNSSVVICSDTYAKYFEDHPDEREYNYGPIISQIMNYEMLTNADVFIGTQGSSFSEDVWLSRYYQGKGSSNYEITRDGIVPVGNDGLKAEPFNCWRRS